MKKISDRFTLGVIGGIAAAFPWRILNTWEYDRGYTELKYGQLAAGLFVPKGAVDDPQAAVVGRIGNQVLLAGTGVAITYLLSISGRDKSWLKGAGLTSLLWLSLYGLATRMKVVSARPRRANTVLLSYLDHVGLGATMGLLISVIGDDAIFPVRDSAARTLGETPLESCLRYEEESKPGSMENQ